MTAQKNDIQELSAMLYKVLKQEIGGRKCCLLDLPNYYNPGDQLIWEGEEQLLKKLGVKVNYRASLHFFNPQMIKKGDCILLQGGGNFGDIYYKHQAFREYIVKSFPANKIIMLPATIHFGSAKKLTQSFEVFRKHPQLMICARDQKSFAVLLKNFPRERSYLLPDTAFAIGSIKKMTSKNRDNKLLYLSRTDGEKPKGLQEGIRNDDNVEVSDWPQFTPLNLSFHYIILKLNILVLEFLKIFGTRWHSRYDVFGLIQVHSKEKQIKEAIKLLSGFDLIITSRLHGHILACLVGIPNILLDNNYGKNKYFYITWEKYLSRESYFAETTKELTRALQTVNN